MNRLPRGCINVGGSVAISMDRCRKVFMDLFAPFGYEPFWPSVLQLLESAWPHLPLPFRRRLIALNTPYGEPCCLKADLTLAAVAYFASHYAPGQQPLRLCYADRIFKRPERHENRIESFQIGAELLGWEGEGADIEILWLLLQWLDGIGLDQSVLVIGDVTFLQYALTNVKATVAERLSTYLQEGNLVAYEKALSTYDIPEYSYNILKHLPHLKGGEGILNRGDSLMGSSQHLAPLRKIFHTLDDLGYAERITLDLSLIRELHYYSGPVFHIYACPSGPLIGGGGRYDGLLAEYGLGGQAIGFAVDLEEIATLSHHFSTPCSAMIWSALLPPESALKRASAIFKRGIRGEISWNNNEKQSYDSAKERGYEWWINLATEEVTNLKTHKKTPLTLWKRGEIPCSQ